MHSDHTNIDYALNEIHNFLSQKTPAELETLMENDDEIIKLIGNLSEVQHLEATKESLKNNIRRLALRNLDSEPILLHEKEKLAELFQRINSTKKQYQSTVRQYEELVGERNPEMIWVLLQTEASELERTTDESADEFFYGNKTDNEVTEFEHNFIEGRKRVHELKIKAEKLHDLLPSLQ